MANSDIIKIGFDYRASLEQFEKETNGVFDGISDKAGKQKITIQLDAKDDKIIDKIKELQKLKLDKFTFEFGNSGLKEQLQTFDKLENKINEIISLSKGIDLSFNTKNKTEAYNQLKKYADAFKEYYGNEEAMATNAGAKTGYAYYKAYEEALRKGVAQRKLEKVTVDFDVNDSIFSKERIVENRIKEFENFQKYGNADESNLIAEITLLENRLLKFNSAYSQVKANLGDAPITPEITKNIEEYVRLLEVAENRAKDAELFGYSNEDINSDKELANMYLDFAKEDATAENKKYIESLKQEETQATATAEAEQKLTEAQKETVSNTSNSNNSQIEELKSDIQEVKTELGDVKDRISSIESNGFENVREDVEKTKESVKELNSELTEMKSNLSSAPQESNISSGMKDAFPNQDVSASVESATNSITEENNVLEQNTQKVKENTQAKEQNANVNLNGYDKRLDSYQGKINKYDTTIKRFEDGGWSSDTYLKNVQAVRDAVKQYATLLDHIKTNQNGIASDEDIQNLDKYEKKIKDTIATVTNMSASEKGYTKLAGQKEIDKINQILRENSAMSSEAKAKIKAYKQELISGNPSTSLEKIHGEIMKIVNAEELAGRAGRSFIDTLKNSGFHQIAAQMAGMFGFYDVINVIKQTASTVTELNTQITELAKVSEQSSKQIYADFDSYADIAKEVRGTISDTIAATADWSKNGYSIPDSKQLAEISQLYKNVGDGIDIDAANESLISTLKGFQLEADQAEHIVDVFNEVSNNEAISSGGIGEALQRSAASFNAASTSLEKSVSLVTATNSVLQDPEKVGNMWRTVSARLRGSETELKEMGEDTDGLVTSTSKLQALVKGITGFDIMKDKDTYKDIYDIVLGIGEKWQDLSDIDRASLLEALAGKQQSNALAAALSNIDILKKSYEEATKAEGSAREENEEYSKSIQASIDLAHAKLEQLANNTLNSDFLKGAIDAGGKLIDILDGIVKSGNAISIVFTTISGYLGSKNLGWQTKMTLWCDAQYIPRAEVRILGQNTKNYIIYMGGYIGKINYDCHNRRPLN